MSWWSTTWPLLAGGGGGGGLVTGARALWHDKKEIEAKYKAERAEALKLLREAREGYETITGDLGKIMDKLGIEHDQPVKMYQQ